MKRILTILAVITASLVAMAAANASELHYNKIPVELVSPATTGNALETHYGDIIKLREIALKPAGSKIGSVLSRSQIELRNGDIFYPEEIKFVLNFCSRRSAAAISEIREVRPSFYRRP